MDKNYKFIVFEGINGSGKDTQLQKLANYIKRKDKYSNVLITSFPTKPIPKVKAEQFDFFISDKINGMKCLSENKIPNLFILCSRFDISTYAYQDESFEKTYNSHQYIYDHFIPDITFVINISPETAMCRITNRGEKIEEDFENFDRLIKASDKQLLAIDYLSEKKNT